MRTVVSGGRVERRDAPQEILKEASNCNRPDEQRHLELEHWILQGARRFTDNHDRASCEQNQQRHNVAMC
jgi:hypothetical protein